MNKKITLIVFILVVIIFTYTKIEAQSAKNLVNIYFFHSDTCSHCKEENKLLEKLEQRYDNIKIYKYEIHNKNTKNILKKVNEIYNLKTNGVPITIIGNEVYIGFLHEKSNLKFIKTIEYYSKYGYIDKLGEYLELDLPTYEINRDDPNLEDFINNYHNYKLLGLKSDNLDISNISIILGILNGINITTLITITFILFIIIINLKNIKKELFFIITYLIIKISLLLVTIINNQIFSNSIYIIILFTFIFGIIKILNNKKNYIILNTIIIISCIEIYIIKYLSNDNIIIFKNILNLHNLEGLNKLAYYSNYILTNLIMNIIIIYVEYFLLQCIIKFFNKHKR